WLWWRFSVPPSDGVVEAFNAYARTVLPAGRASHTAINAMIAAALDRAYPDVPDAQRRDKWDGLRSELRFLQMSPLDHPRALRALEEYARFEPLVRECDGLLRYAAVRTEAPTGSKALFNLPS